MGFTGASGILGLYFESVTDFSWEIENGEALSTHLLLLCVYCVLSLVGG